MLKPPKIVITNIDDDPKVKKKRKHQKMAEIGALCSILAINWIMVISKSCFVFGMLSGVMTTLITIMQYCLLMKTRCARVHFGPKVNKPYSHEHTSLFNSLRWSSTWLTNFFQSRLSNRIASIPKETSRKEGDCP